MEEFSKLAILTDENVAKHWLPDVKKSLNRPVTLIVIKPGEKEKNLKTASFVWKELIKNNFDRKSLLINLGGGVICDLGGFCASTFMRGIPFVQISITLLAMVDASIGGKTGINFSNLKNIIGVINQPIKVVTDIRFLKTLSKQDLISGFAEAIKHGIIADVDYFDLVTSKKPEEFNEKELIKIINGSIKIKSEIVKKDEKEQGLRKILNFGHTIGHAVERPLTHGEAIAIGMIGEAKLANLIGLLSAADLLKIERTIENTGLPIKVKNISLKRIFKKIINDKKNSSGKILWALPEKIGQAIFDVEAPEKLVIKAINYVITN